ncbi:arylesterase [Pseudothauera nasutitermitis]|uniref:Arylesterase n=1 Tax=Pseudothauera nasutitermitis TaxID=2565930 RepID=A0A4S4B7T6_9RHOO|nr:GDSL-type esterase/lipase family protein [Pseudothauera nasutitermitis]THF67073.1 arylesterase [Pseudothauera nasutitermitis]
MLLRRLFLLLCAPLLLTACGGSSEPRQSALPTGTTVLVIGDSLVAGTGASRETSWPAELARRSGWEVINAGIPGNTSADARGRLRALLDTHHPEAVIVAIGGNDFLRRQGLDGTRANIEAMLEESRVAATHVALVAIPEPSLGGSLVGRLSDHPLYREIAEAQGVALLPDAVSETLSRAELRADRVHANAAGYAFMAERIADALVERGWLAH